jgi:hypothetical protein
MKLMLDWLRIGTGITSVIIAILLLVDTARVTLWRDIEGHLQRVLLMYLGYLLLI